ncbi:helix-turn-helix domain-containing protein [Thioalkalivibrio sp. AKL6]|uniref:helix-turn-helix domain-containing protein n=1 Tax=Thioalkalivibrio sp. AKL6 TaxID=1158154 RepID=UPI00035CF476|nr:helix-turn-helix domain-containing protein [Thioalkalivibrio sp. AKL6]
MARHKKRGEAHARIYGWEQRTVAWQTMSPEGKALLIELRLLYQPSEGNRVFLSLREIQRRLNVGRRVAERARDELIERGWIRVISPGHFSMKVRHATVYALENEPLRDGDGATAPKTYMRWQPGK